MYDFDVIFLLLSSPSSSRFGQLLRLQDVAANTGFHTSIATSPEQLVVTSKRLRVVVIDGDQEGGFDPYAVTASLDRLNDVQILFLSDASTQACERGLAAGASLCLPVTVSEDDFCFALMQLSRTEPSPEPQVLEHKVVASDPVPVAESGWTLASSGWVLRTPQGDSLRLTATERDLMTHLFSAVDKTVYHAQWDGRYGRIVREKRGNVSALSVLVGRLRRKCARQDIKLPLYVKRGSGYWFVEKCRIAQDKGN